MNDAVELRNIPNTNIRSDMKINSLPSTQRFLQRILEFRDEYNNRVVLEDTDADADIEHGDDVGDELFGWKLELCESDLTSGNDLYHKYKLYCIEENERPQTMQKFGRDVKAMITKRKNHGVMKYDLSSIIRI